jgi:hypothetical protein
MSHLVHRRGAERRVAFRVPICLPVMAECEAFSRGFVTKDISATGIYLIGELDAQPAASLSLELHLPGDLGVLRAAAAVIRLQQDLPRGFGLAWTRLAEADRRRLAELDRRWRQAFPSDSSPP